MTELLGRLGLAAFVLMLAAAVAATTGSQGVGGRVGGLFGFRPPALAAPAEPVTLKPVSRATLIARAGGRHDFVPVTRLGGERRPRRVLSPSVPRRRSPSVAQPAPQGTPTQLPAPAPVPTPAPAPLPRPLPSTPGATERVVQVARQLGQAVPVAQAPVEQVAQTVGRVCALAAGCPVPRLAP